MTGMNRVTEDGRPILIDGEFDDAYNLHASIDPIDPGELDETIQAANLHAADALKTYIVGEWTLDVAETEAFSPALQGRPTQPILLTIDAGGEVDISAPGISLNFMGMQIDVGLKATGQLELQARLEDDEVHYSSRLIGLDISNTHADIAGFFDAGPIIEPIIKQLAAAGATDQDIEVEQGDTEDSLTLIGTDVTHVLRRPRPVNPRFALAKFPLTKHAPTATRVELSPKPYAIKQPNDTTCWATAICSTLNTIRFAAMPGPPTPDAPREIETVDSVIAQMQAFIDANNADPERLGTISIQPGTNTLMSHPGYLGWTVACQKFGIGKPHYYSCEKEEKDRLTLEIVADYIDAGMYVVLNYTQVGWDKLPGGEYMWHVVICYGYDTRLRKILVMDPEIGFYAVARVQTDRSYYFTPVAPIPYGK